MPRVTRTRAPPNFRTSYAICEARISEETPTADSVAHRSTPRLLPAIAASAVRRPERAEVRMIVAVAGPGVRLTTTATSRKLGQEFMPPTIVSRGGCSPDLFRRSGRRLEAGGENPEVRPARRTRHEGREAAGGQLQAALEPVLVQQPGPGHSVDRLGADGRAALAVGPQPLPCCTLGLLECGVLCVRRLVADVPGLYVVRALQDPGAGGPPL